MSRLITILAALLLLASPAAAEPWAPRDVAASVAAQIDENYFDEERAAQVSAHILERAAAGAYDGLDDPFRLAAALTETIAPYDGHFRVAWSPPEAEEEPEVRGRELYGFGEMIRRNGNGFREVAILPANIGYIAMTNFADIDFADPHDPVRRSADGALALVAETDAVIIDLRDNGGGAPSMVGYLTSAFTAPDADIYNSFVGRGPDMSEAPEVYHPAPRLDVPLYVLISARTGSAAESFAYTLKNAGRAAIIGEASTGAANPGGMVDAGHGFSVFVSFGSPVSPVTGRNWEGDGVQPDVPIDAEDALAAAQRIALDRLAETTSPAYAQDLAWARAALDPAAIGVELAAYTGDFGPLTISVADDGLRLEQGRRPPATLVPLGDDLFYRANDPLRRYRYVRGASGAIEAIESQHARGTISRYERAQ